MPRLDQESPPEQVAYTESLRSMQDEGRPSSPSPAAPWPGPVGMDSLNPLVGQERTHVVRRPAERAQPSTPDRPMLKRLWNSNPMAGLTFALAHPPATGELAATTFLPLGRRCVDRTFRAYTAETDRQRAAGAEHLRLQLMVQPPQREVNPELRKNTATPARMPGGSWRKILCVLVLHHYLRPYGAATSSATTRGTNGIQPAGARAIHWKKPRPAV